MSRMKVTLEVEVEFSPAAKGATMLDAAKTIECKMDDSFGYVINEKVLKVKRVKGK